MAVAKVALWAVTLAVSSVDMSADSMAFEKVVLKEKQAINFD
jgi:hypothetical protein